MAYNFEYPYTDPNRYNTDWEIHKVKELNSRVTDIERNLEQKVEELFKPLEDALRALIDGQLADMRRDLADTKDDIFKKVEDTAAAINAEIAGIKSDIVEININHNKDITNLYTYIGDRFDIVRDLIHEVDVDSKGRDEALRVYIDRQIEKVKVEISKEIPIINPIIYKVDNLQDSLDDSVHALRYGGLTALQYEARHWSAGEYDILSMSAYLYDIYARFKYHLLNPFTGVIESIEKWLTDITTFIRPEPMTAESYDDKDYSAEEFQDMGLNSYEYDFFAEGAI